MAATTRSKPRKTSRMTTARKPGTKKRTTKARKRA